MAENSPARAGADRDRIAAVAVARMGRRDLARIMENQLLVGFEECCATWAESEISAVRMG
jgi:hypothetical protein